MSLLEKIKSPAELKSLKLSELDELAKEIRQLIVSTIGQNGGHMASNLGVVELTIAVHRIFNSPKDTILFDVSHQSYAHKILTGRAEGFEHIRTSGGFSGYFDPGESDHDILALGHAGCAPSIALGVALSSTMLKRDKYVVCICGDGSFTSGLAYEGLSNIVAANPRNLMVILNDNGMAISKNVGWLANWRSQWLPNLRDRLELDDDFQEFEKVTEALAPKIPLGEVALSLGKGVKSAIQKALVPEMGHVFDEMGFNYLGPVDGHNVNQLIETIQSARLHSDKVPLIHVLTNKGQGWEPAANDPTKYHQPGPPSTGEKKPTYSKVFADSMIRLMAENPKIVAISAAMLEGTGLTAVKEIFTDRVFDVGICEQHAVSMAAGMAREGLIPVVCIYSTFLQRAYDQILHDICMNGLHVVFAIDRAGMVGQDGKTHHGLFDISYMRTAPNMTVTVPKDENEMRHLLWTAVRGGGAWSIRFPRGEGRGVDTSGDMGPIQMGAAEVLLQGEDICLLCVGETSYHALDAVQLLQEEGINPAVVNLRFIKPIDSALGNALLDGYKEVWVIEDGTSVGGAAAAVMQAVELAKEERGRPLECPMNIHSIAIPDEFPDHAEIPELRHAYSLDAQGIAARVLKCIKGGA
jgi:1-deoxy-D-xylulose-5-phosphate synthase